MTAAVSPRRPEKELLVASKVFTVENRRTSWWVTVSTFTFLAALTATAALAPVWWVRLPVACFTGLVIVRAFCLFHDFQHGAILRNSKVARGLYWFFGELILSPPSVWRETHNYHHAHTAKIVGSHIGSYPMLTPAMYAQATPLQRWLYRAARHPLNMVFAWFSIFGIGMCLRPFLRAPKKHWGGLVSLLLVAGLATACTLAGRPDVFVFTWLSPYGIAAATGAYLFYAQHNFPEAQVADRQNWSFTGAALDSSSYMKMGPLMNWLTANIGFHHVHHLNAAIPFYRLPEAMAAIPELQHPGTTSFSIGDVVACFRLKLWDPEAHKLVPYP
ncbi:MAG: fatty acid desaturase, partial [Archangium sp.]|nr:fatty acid desaturase [Archangium sp.]